MRNKIKVWIAKKRTLGWLAGIFFVIAIILAAVALFTELPPGLNLASLVLSALTFVPTVIFYDRWTSHNR